MHQIKMLFPEEFTVGEMEIEQIGGPHISAHLPNPPTPPKLKHPTVPADLGSGLPHAYQCSSIWLRPSETNQEEASSVHPTSTPGHT